MSPRKWDQSDATAADAARSVSERATVATSGTGLPGRFIEIKIVGGRDRPGIVGSGPLQDRLLGQLREGHPVETQLVELPRQADRVANVLHPERESFAAANRST